jgi:putative nucleotidyltransferase with HDIG domain
MKHLKTLKGPMKPQFKVPLREIIREKERRREPPKEVLTEADFHEVLKEDFLDAIKHGVLVSRMAAMVGREMNQSQEFLDNLVLAGMLHDIGKLRLSRFLYGRAKGTLNIEETKYMRRHSQYSYEIVRAAGYNEEIQQMVYHHHENYDGTGYPDNLRGETIPLGARTLKVCDVFCALVSHRPYRAAFDTEVAIELMIDEVKNFDMEIFLMFQRVVNSEAFKELQELIDHSYKSDTDVDLRELSIKEFEEENL